MTMKLRVKRFRTRRPDPVAAVASHAPASAPPEPPRPAARPPVAARIIGDDAFMPGPDADGFAGQSFPTARAAAAAAAPAPAARADDSAPQDIDAIRQEGLTGRQLRMARRLAQKHGLPATSDFDAVRLLRNAGIDPFQANSVLELVSAGGGRRRRRGRARWRCSPAATASGCRRR